MKNRKVLLVAILVISTLISAFVKVLFFLIFLSALSKINISSLSDGLDVNFQISFSFTDEEKGNAISIFEADEERDSTISMVEADEEKERAISTSEAVEENENTISIFEENKEKEAQISKAITERKAKIKDSTTTTDDEIDSNISSSVVDESNEERNKAETNRTYLSYQDFPLGDMPLADDKIFKLYKSAYDDIDFYGEFRDGDKTVYDYYKEKYKKIVNSDRDFTDSETGRRVLFNDLARIKLESDRTKADLSHYKFYLFDMDGDNMPELIIKNPPELYIFKYINDTDEFILWRDLTVGCYIIGSQKVEYTRLMTGVEKEFYKLDENGEYEWSTFLYETGILIGEDEDWTYVYILALPRDEFADKPVETTAEMKEQAYKDSAGNLFYRFTEEQFEEITKDWSKAEELAEEWFEETAQSYEEFFGDFLPQN